ncbi:hypothetical protein GDO81_022292 [Engystomops pustulosus]|uniref:Olfactory receptor n=1 Tax=Engystomops pustulosus TaxID=76066 RepID=A0AAV6ZNW2_ENGPU|nr:hypothetical protein GDO81_022292 [Engystomops pustulosus]
MKNQTSITSVLLMSLSDDRDIIHVLFIFSLLIYLMTVFSNFLIILLVFTYTHLHTPMYFFLVTLSFMDMSYSSVTAPKMLLALTTRDWSISLQNCTAQAFFVVYFVASEAYLLSSMSYDRYVAICYPLHYSQVMSWSKCTQMVSLVCSSALVAPIIFILCLRRLTFCGPKLIQNFFCDLPHLFQISCTDPTINVLLLMLVGGGLGIINLVATLYPYVRIFRTVLRIGTSDGKSKAFSTCTSHLTVVVVYYASVTFIYFVPNTSEFLTLNQVVTVIYTQITPLLNPLIFSLRNKDLKAALQRSFHKPKLHPIIVKR